MSTYVFRTSAHVILLMLFFLRDEERIYPDWYFIHRQDDKCLGVYGEEVNDYKVEHTDYKVDVIGKRKSSRLE